MSQNNTKNIRLTKLICLYLCLNNLFNNLRYGKKQPDTGREL